MEYRNPYILQLFFCIFGFGGGGGGWFTSTREDIVCMTHVLLYSKANTLGVELSKDDHAKMKLLFMGIVSRLSGSGSTHHR